MNKKTKAAAIFIALLLIPFFLNAETMNHMEFFAQLRSGTVLPVDSVIGQTFDGDSTQVHSFLEQALSEEFSLEWCEKYLDTSTKKAVTTVFSEQLGTFLPAKNFIMSKGLLNGDKSVSVSVKSGETILSFTVLDSKILSVGTCSF